MEDVVELRWLFSVIRRWLWLIAVCALLGAAGGFLASSRMTPVYSASATLLVQQAPAVGTSDLTAIHLSEQLARAYIQMLRQQPVLEAAIARLGLDETPDVLAGSVSAELIPDTQMIRLSVVRTDPAQAPLVANAIAEEFIAQSKALQAERYADSLASIEQQMIESSALISETQAQVNDLRMRMVQDQTESARIEAVLAEYRSAYAALRQDYGQIRLSAAQSADSVSLVEPAQVQQNPPRSSRNASVILLVQSASAVGTGNYGEQLARTYILMLGQRSVLEAVIARLELDESPDVLAESVSAELIPETQLIRLGVERADAAQAALIANTIAEEFIAHSKALQAGRYADSLNNIEEQMAESSALISEAQVQVDNLQMRMVQDQAELDRLETVLAEYRGTYATLQQDYGQMRLTAAQSTDNLSVVEPAREPKRPVSRRNMYILLAAVVGAMAAVGVAFLVEHLTDMIRTPEDVSRALGLDTLGAIGQLTKKDGNLVVATQPLSPVAEAFRVLCTNVRFSGANGSPRIILVTSPGPREGKSITAANLGVAMAQAGLSVVVVDADLRRPRMDQLFGLDPKEGGTGGKPWWGVTGSLLEGHVDGRLQPTQTEGLRILPSGELPPNPAEVMGSQHMQKLLHELAQQADTVLVDSPPALLVADATALARAVDGVLLVLEAGRTRRQGARRTIESLHQVGANLIGVVLNGVSTHRGSYYYYSYHEAYSEGRGRRKLLRRLFGGRRKVG